jgi:ribose 5-phosphate isomerase B
MRIAFGTDETTALTEAIQAAVDSAGHEVVVVADGDPWPDVGHLVGDEVASGRASMGVVCCWTDADEAPTIARVDVGPEPPAV